MYVNLAISQLDFCMRMSTCGCYIMGRVETKVVLHSPKKRALIEWIWCEACFKKRAKLSTLLQKLGYELIQSQSHKP